MSHCRPHVRVVDPVNPADGPRRCATARAVTLVELILSLSIAALILGGIASAMIIATRVIPSSGSPLRPVSDGSFALERMLMELQTAKSISELSSTAITAVVSDITGDAVDDTIRYAWSGVRDAPLTRSINGAAASSAIPSVRGFALGYGPFAKTTKIAQVATTVSGSQTISSFSGWVGVTIPVVQNWTVSTNDWVSVQFIPFSTVPYNAKSLAITGINCTIRGTGTTGTIQVGVYPTEATNCFPTMPVIGTPVSIASASLNGSYASQGISFSDVVIDNPFAGYSVRFHGVGGSIGAIRALFGAGLAPANETIGGQTTNGGGTWTPSSANLHAYDVPHTISGTYTTETRSYVDETRYYLRTITAAVVLSDGTPTQCSAGLLNEPDVTGLWTPAVESDGSLFDIIINLVGNVLRIL